jgi:secreted trypsin-like serine protease
MVALINASSPVGDIYNAQFCGGVVVDERLVLTAAHCVEKRGVGTIDAVVGGDNLCRDGPIDGVRIHITRIQIHPAYDSQSARFDLAVLALAVDAPPDSVREVASPPPEGGPAVALGWSRGAQGGVAPCHLVDTALTLLVPPKCEEQAGARDRPFDPESMLCAIPEQPTQDTCSGDSGGPLVIGADPQRREVIGITSWGRACGNGLPGVYARADAWLFERTTRALAGHDASFWRPPAVAWTGRSTPEPR